MDKCCVWAGFLLILFIAVPSDCQTGRSFCPTQTSQEVITCPQGYVLYPQRERCFKVVQERASWYTVRKICQEEGADLAVILDRDTDEFIKAMEGINETYWIGLKEVFERTNRFKWVNGKDVTYSGFALAEPNNNNSKEDCVAVWKTGTCQYYEWSDTICQSEFSAICEKEPNGLTNIYEVSSLSCPYGYVLYGQGKTCFKVVNVKKAWNDARTACEEDNGDLAIIPNDQTNRFIMASSTRDKKYWIGLRNSQSTTTHRWIDGFSRNYPFLVHGSTDHGCVSMHGHYDRLNCSLELFYICEKVPFTTAVCPDGWTMYPEDQTCFKAYNDRQKWNSSRELCQTEGGDLAMVRDMKTSLFVKDLLHSVPRTWVGWTSSYNLQWLDGTPFNTYSIYAWNLRTEGQECGTIWFIGGMHGYEDYTCWKDIAFHLCQKEPAIFGCPRGYTMYFDGLTCLKVNAGDHLNMTEARCVCKEVDNGSLVDIGDKRIDDFLTHMLPDSNMTYWIHKHYNMFQFVGGNDLWNNSVTCLAYTPGTNGTGIVTKEYCDEEYEGFVCQHPGYLLGDVVDTPTSIVTSTNTPTSKVTSTITPTSNVTSTNTSTYPVTPNNTHTTVSVNLDGPLLRHIVLQGETYQYSAQPQQYSDMSDLCQRRNLTEFIIQSNEQFWQFQNIMSPLSALYGHLRIWIKTNKPLYWDWNYWGNNEFVDPNAWAIGVHSTTPCFKGHISDCCVVLKVDHIKNDSYLFDAPCTDTAYGLCVEENNVTGITIAPLPALELVMTAETVSLLKNLTAPKNGSVVNKLCPCRCRDDKIDFNPSPAALLSILNRLQKELKVEATQLSSTRNKKVSAQDKRTSSKAIGYVGIALCAVPLGFMIFFDVLRLFHVQT